MSTYKEIQVDLKHLIVHSRSAEAWEKYLKELDEEIQWLKDWEKDIENRKRHNERNNN